MIGQFWKLKELKQKHGAKLKIRFFTEGLRETVDRNRVTAQFLEAHGVEVRYGSTHAKGFCVDGRYVLFGSTNLTNQSLLKNNEANLLIDDKKMADGFLAYFDHLWNGGGHGEIELPAPFLADGSFKDVLIFLIQGAQKKVEFSIYFFNHREIENALIDAHQRGAKITGLIHQHNAFAMPYIRANRVTVKRLRSAGLTDLHFGDPSIFSHSKYLVVDRKEIALGTGNWLVEDVEIHPQLYIHLKDAGLARAMVKHLTSQIKRLIE
ncbi:MAG TPA: phospholipase D-like domain-containing protein [Bacteriovoracaceae bacterium]|nr:phospholipase D-like domain-containing protein [Bacteriovoracaceae bacterium]